MVARKITFLGLGSMGSRMARNLVQAGHAVTVWNRSAAATEALAAIGARVASSPKAAAGDAEFVISMVTNDAASSAVWLDADTGALAGLDRSAIAIESSTVTPQWIERLATAIEGRGATLLDAPVSGSLPQAETRELVVMVGGEHSSYVKSEAILSAMAGTVHYIGRNGQGVSLKLAVNSLLGIQIAAVGELLGFLQKSGLPPNDVLDVLAKMPVASPAVVAAAKLMVAGDFKPRFPIDLVAKDFGYAVDSAARVGAELPVTDATRTVLERLRASGFGAENISAVARLFIETAG